MKTTLHAGTVLVAAERVADAAQVRRTLIDDFDTVEVSTGSDLVVADFERVLPDVVVLAFDTIEKAQAYCLGLLRFSKVAQSHSHRYVILCANADAGAAFALCKKEYFDDYVPFWPQPHDGHRLVMAVWNSARRLLASPVAVPSQSEIAAHAESALALGAAVDRRLDQGLRHVAAIQDSWASVEREVGRGPAAESVKVALAASRASLAPISGWAEGFRTEVAPHLADAQVFAGKVKSRRPVVLVVEDDAFAAKIIGKALEQQNFDLEFAAAAPAVFEFLRRVQPIAILMDINLPGMDGLALTAWLKASPTLSHIPVLMLTGEATREAIERSQAAGAAGFVVKPFTREALIAQAEPAHRLSPSPSRQQAGLPRADARRPVPCSPRPAVNMHPDPLSAPLARATGFRAGPPLLGAALVVVGPHGHRRGAGVPERARRREGPARDGRQVASGASLEMAQGAHRRGRISHRQPADGGVVSELARAERAATSLTRAGRTARRRCANRPAIRRRSCSTSRARWSPVKRRRTGRRRRSCAPLPCARWPAASPCAPSCTAFPGPAPAPRIDVVVPLNMTGTPARGAVALPHRSS